MSRPAQIFVLAEDALKTQHRFIRAYLRKRGFAERQIRDIPVPMGETAGIQFVFEQLVVEVKNLRKVPYSRALIVVVDGDKHTFEQRKAELDQKLRQAGISVRLPAEQIAFVVPCRNIETWVWHFEGNEADESTNYKKSHVKPNHDLSLAKSRFAEFCISGKTSKLSALPALEDAREELKRVQVK